MELVLDNKKDFYNKMFKIAIPVILMSLATIGLNILDTIMINSLGKEYVAATSMSNKFMFILYMLVSALNGSLNIFISRHLGKGDEKHAVSALGHVIKINKVLSVIFIILALMVPRQILSMYNQNPMFLDIGVNYLKIASFSYFFMTISLTMATGLKAEGKTYNMMYVSIFALMINTLLNYLLIFGNFGFPMMAEKGAALATVVARVVECILLFNVFKKNFNVIDVFKHKMEEHIRKNFYKLAVPKLVGDIFWVVGVNVMAIMYTNIGITGAALFALISPLEDFTMAFFTGMNVSYIYALNIKIGEKKFGELKRLIIEFLKITIILSIVLTIIDILFGNVLISLYSLSAADTATLKNMVIIFIAAILMKGIEKTLCLGVLDAAGDCWFVFYADMIAMWFFTMPAIYIIGYVYKLPFEYIYASHIMRIGVRLIFILARLKSKKWIMDV
ncbi:MAG: MATE family efflux transporter [Clostridia bacterium]|jgi:putative MATE family efflux protein|nr:MATE family efflux transporter [Clostridia bacterium]